MEWPVPITQFPIKQVQNELGRKMKNRSPINTRQLWKYLYKQNNGKV